MTVIVSLDRSAAETLRTAIGPDTDILDSLQDVSRHLADHPAESVIVVAPSIDMGAALSLAESLRVSKPHIGVVLVRQRVDSTLLAEALRCGVRDVVGDRDLSAVSDAVRRARELAMRMRQHSDEDLSEQEARRGRVITVFSAKGGCGKTTVSTNLAATLADGGKRQVCLVDLDLAFGDVSIALQLFPAHTIADAVPLADTLDVSGLRALLTQHSPGLAALSAPLEPGQAEHIPASLVSDLLQILRDQFDFVVIDTPPAFTDHVLAAFDISDVVALLATLDIPAVKNLKLSLETLELLNYPKEKWRVVLNRADSKVGLDIGEVAKSLHLTIAAQIPSSRAVPASINRGVPIALDEPQHPVSQAIRLFAEQHVLPMAGTGASAIPASLRNDRRGLLRRKAKQT